MTTLREAAIAQGRYEGFTEAGDLLRVLAEAGLSSSAIAAAMTAQKNELGAEADRLHDEAEATQTARATRRAAREEATA